MRQDLLAGPRLAQHEHRRVRARHALEHRGTPRQRRIERGQESRGVGVCGVHVRGGPQGQHHGGAIAKDGVPRVYEVAGREQCRLREGGPVQSRPVARAGVFDEKAGVFAHHARVQKRHARVGDLDGQRRDAGLKHSLGRTLPTPPDENAIDVGERVPRASGHGERALEHHEQVRRGDLGRLTGTRRRVRQRVSTTASLPVAWTNPRLNTSGHAFDSQSTRDCRPSRVFSRCRTDRRGSERIA